MEERELKLMKDPDAKRLSSKKSLEILRHYLHNQDQEEDKEEEKA